MTCDRCGTDGALPCCPNHDQVLCAGCFTPAEHRRPAGMPETGNRNPVGDYLRRRLTKILSN